MKTYPIPRSRFQGVKVKRIYRDPKPQMVQLGLGPAGLQAAWLDPYGLWMADHLGYVPTLKAWLETVPIEDCEDYITEHVEADFNSDADLLAFLLSISDE